MKTRKIIIHISVAAFLLFSSSAGTMVAYAQNTLTSPSASEDPTKSSFRLVICDGPDLSGVSSSTVKQQLMSENGSGTYVPCNFNGAMMQVQHFITICMVLGVFAAILLFMYAGYLFLTGKEGDRKKAYDVFPKVFWGFIIMLTAWFVVYQILNWLTGNSIFGKLLGNP